MSDTDAKEEPAGTIALWAALSVVDLIRLEELPLSERLERVADMIPLACLEPELGAARVRIDDVDVETAGFGVSDDVFSVPIEGPEGERGCIEAVVAGSGAGPTETDVEIGRAVLFELGQMIGGALEPLSEPASASRQCEVDTELDYGGVQAVPS